MNRRNVFQGCALAVVSLVLGINGCGLVRKVTYPVDFVYLDAAQIRSSMADFSVDVWRIDDILAHAETVMPYQREEIIELLKHMESTADGLGAGIRETNHLLIDTNIDQFRSDVIAARIAVESEPPNYYRAGRLSGGCLACHVLR